jgi:mycothiol S-conjugate amidase
MYYSVWSRTRLIAVHEAMLAKNGKSPYDDKWLNRPGQDERITTRIHVASHMSARSGALRAHATQVDPNESWWFGLDDDELATAYPYEDWVLAKSAVGAPEADVVEIDLFAGIKDVIALEPGQSVPSRLSSPGLVETEIGEVA